MQDNPLRDLSVEEKQILADLARSKANGEISRRDLLQAGGALGVGAALGASGSIAASQPARAASNQSGTIGSPTDREDWFAEDIDAVSLSTDSVLNSIGSAKLQASFNGLVVPVAPGLGMADAVNPSSTSTPVQDAIDAVNTAGGGVILLPPETVQESTTVVNPGNVGIFGHGIDRSIIEITGTGSTVHGLDLQGGQTQGDGFEIRGPGETSTTGHAITSTSNSSQHYYGRVRVRHWGGKAIDFTPSTVFGFHMNKFEAYNIDNGGGPLIDWSSGQQNTMGNVLLDPVSTRTGLDSAALKLFGVRLEIGFLNLGGTIGGESTSGAVVDTDFSQFSCQQINFEPTTQNGTPSSVVLINENRPKTIGGLEIVNATVDYAYEFNNAQNAIAGPVQNSGTVLNTLVNLASDNDSLSSWYWGAASDVTNNSGKGAGTTNLRALATAGTQV